MLKKHIKRAPCEIKRVQRTFLCERGEGKIKFSESKIFEECWIRRVAISTGINLVYNLDLPEPNDFYEMVESAIISQKFS